jgi:hypothetical protein
MGDFGLSATVIDFKTRIKYQTPTKHLNPMQVRTTLVLDLIINELRIGNVKPENFFVMYGIGKGKDVTWNYMALNFTPETLEKALENIYRDMKAR